VKGVSIDAFGGPDQLCYGEIDPPSPSSGSATIRVRACALNHLDLWVLKGLPAYKLSLPHILGNDICGEVQEDPTGRFSPGDKVIVSPGVSCWKCTPCLNGRDNLCETYSILGADGGWGGLAEIASVPSKNLLPLPSGLSFEEGASLPLTLLTSFHMLSGLARLRKDETALVIGAGSGVGSAAIQIAKALGARVIAASTSEEKLKLAKELGADDTILGPGDKLARKIRQATGGSGVDVVFEHVGGAIFSDALRSLRHGGRLVTCGATADPMPALDLRHVFFKELQILGAKMGPLKELEEALQLVEAGSFRPVVDKVFELADTREAFEYLASGSQFGKVVLRC